MDEPILYDDIDAIVLGDGSEEFLLRMFRRNPDSYQVNEYGSIRQVTRVISTEKLWIHFNFWFITEDTFEHVLNLIQEDCYLGIITYLVDDIASFHKARELYDKYLQDSMLPSKDLPHKKSRVPAYPVINDEVNLINLWYEIEPSINLGAGIMVAIGSERKTTAIMKERNHDLLKNVKFVCASEESPFFEEKESIYVWMFENYKKKSKKLKVADELIAELKLGLRGNKSGCNVI